MSLLDFPEPKSRVEQEQEMLQSIENFLMATIYPKLTKQQKAKVDLHIARGLRVKAAFEFAGIKTAVCMR